MSYPRRLDLGAYLARGSADAESKKTQYELAAILVHQGTTAYSGHYYALVEDPVKRKWFKFNDESVTVLEGKRVPGTDGNAATVSYFPAYRIGPPSVCCSLILSSSQICIIK